MALTRLRSVSQTYGREARLLLNVLEAALDYLDMGFSIVPVAKNKKALVPWRDFQKVRPTPEQVKDWWTRNPDANVAILTGELSGLTVIDCDSQVAIDHFKSNYSGDTPSVKTPKGMHFYFKYLEGSRNGARVLPDTDIRSEGGYVIAPPSTNGQGRGYTWVRDIEAGCDTVSSLYSFISFSAFTDTRGVTDTESQRVTRVTKSHIFFNQGTRDEDLFHAANCMIKGYAEPEFVKPVLEILARGCNPPYPEKDIEIKIQSAMERSKRRDMTLTEELRVWIESQNGHWKVTQWSQESQRVTKSERHATIVALKRFCDEGLIRSCGKWSGTYEKVDQTDTEQQWWLDDGQPLNIHFPLGIEAWAKVFPGNIILLEGQKSQGKSTFCIEFSRLNKDLFYGRPILYQNVEMASSEFKDRFKSYESEKICKIEEWRAFLKIIRETSNWYEKIVPDAINVVDYLVEYDKPYILPQFIFAIHKKLTTGIALVVVQRDPFKPYPTGGRGVRDIPRLCISLIHHKMRLEDVKSFWPTEHGNPSGMTIDYKQVAWCKWINTGPWHEEEEEKYRDFKK